MPLRGQRMKFSLKENENNRSLRLLCSNLLQRELKGNSGQMNRWKKHLRKLSLERLVLTKLPKIMVSHQQR